MKLKAPKHVTGIFACGHEVRADENGVAELENPSAALLDAMRAAGWLEIVETGGEAPPVLAPPAKSKAPAADAADEK